MLAYMQPELITMHDTRSAYVDSYISLLIVCMMLSLMVGFEIWIMHREKELSDEKSKEIEALNQSQNRFFSSMSHEIRTPINTIIGLNEMILRQNASDEINEDATNIQAASKMLLHLINDILDMSKFESGQMELNPVEYHTGDMLSDVVGMLWLKAKEKDLLFQVDISPELPSMLYGDEVRIKQILINVINNAIKYTASGSVRLQIQCEKESGKKVNVIYTVSDTGMGIKKESMPYLFTAFKRVDEGKNRYIEGTGLGLSIVKQFVDLMGGKITVNSVYTKGSTFVIEIPQIRASEDAVGKIDIENRQRYKTKDEYVESFTAPEAKVLVVDDTAANLLVVTKLLSATKVQLDTAASGIEALKKTLDTAYHVILMDHLMPHMDGVACMHAIRTQTGGLCQKSRIIALTANAGSDMEAFYLKEGFDGYLVKPVSGENLENTLYRFLPRSIVTVTTSKKNSAVKGSIAWIENHKKKAQTLVTTESVADLPRELLEKYHISVLLHMVMTRDGLFLDGAEVEPRGLLEYMNEKGSYVEAKSPSVEAHEDFFSDQLENAHNIIHISISSRVEHSGCLAAMDAANEFDNVFVVDTGHLSNGQGLMAIEAARLAEDGLHPEEIRKRMEQMKAHVHTSFIVDTLAYMARAGQVSARIAGLTNAFMMHPVLAMKKGTIKVSTIYFGTKENAWEKYIRSVFRVKGIIDTRILFLTYVGIARKDLEHIRDMVGKIIQFDEIYIQKASPAIAVNCGPGTFGLMFYTKYDSNE